MYLKTDASAFTSLTKALYQVMHDVFFLLVILKDSKNSSKNTGFFSTDHDGELRIPVCGIVLIYHAQIPCPSDIFNFKWHFHRIYIWRNAKIKATHCCAKTSLKGEETIRARV